jgi:hypothetical protein
MMANFQAAVKSPERLEPEFVSKNPLDLQIRPLEIGLKDLLGHMHENHRFSCHQNV